MNDTRRTFHIDACLGRGGFGEVYRARMARGGFEVEVAVKLLRGDVDPRGMEAQRLRDEAKLLGVVRHRCVPRVLDLVELDGRLALVSEYVDGADLSKCLRAAPRLTRRAALEVLAGVADALHTAYHTPVRTGGIARIVHRDLKPANVRVARDGTPKLLDFGIAWTDAVTRAAMTQSSNLVGSPAYMAPERFDGVPPTAAVDTFGVGAMLYEALTGKRLFADTPLKELAALSLVDARYLRAVDERLRDLPPDVPTSLRALVAESLAFHPEARPTAAALAERLEAEASATPGPSLVAWCRERTWPDAVDVGGPWVGRCLSEDVELMLVAEGPAGWSPAASRIEVASETVAVPVIRSVDVAPVTASVEVTVEPVEAAPAPRRLTAWSAAAAALAVVGATAGIAVALSSAPATSITPSAATPPPVAAAPAPARVPPPALMPAAPLPAEVAEPTAHEAAASEPAAREPVARRARSASVTGASAPPARVAPAEPQLPQLDDLLGDDIPSTRMDDEAPAAASAPPAVAAAPRAARPAGLPVTTMTARTMVRLAPDSSAAEVVLSGSAGRFTLPETVPPGTYDLLADTGLGLQRVGRVQVGGSDVVVRCAMGRCNVLP